MMMIQGLDINLKSVHLPAADIVVNRPSKDVHGILNHSSSMKESPSGHLKRPTEAMWTDSAFTIKSYDSLRQHFF